MEILLYVFGLYIVLKSIACFMKEKSKALLLECNILLIPLIYTYLSMDVYLPIIILMLYLIIINWVYIFTKWNNKGVLSIILSIVMAILCGYTVLYFTDNIVSLVIVIALSFTYVFAMDCSDMKGYTTLNVAESILLIVLHLILSNVPLCIISGIYFVFSCVAYIKFNKLEALSSKSKLNREQRRNQEKQKRRK